MKATYVGQSPSAFLPFRALQIVGFWQVEHSQPWNNPKLQLTSHKTRGDAKLLATELHVLVNGKSFIFEREVLNFPKTWSLYQPIGLITFDKVPEASARFAVEGRISSEKCAWKCSSKLSSTKSLSKNLIWKFFLAEWAYKHGNNLQLVENAFRMFFFAEV